MRANPSIHLSRFPCSIFVYVRIRLSPKRVVARNFTKEAFLDFAAVFGAPQTCGEIRVHSSPHDSQVVLNLRRGRGSAVIQNVRSAKPLSRLRFRGEAPAYAAGQLPRKPCSV